MTQKCAVEDLAKQCMTAQHHQMNAVSRATIHSLSSLLEQFCCVGSADLQSRRNCTGAGVSRGNISLVSLLVRACNMPGVALLGERAAEPVM